MTVKLLVNGATIATLPDPVEVVWDEEPPAERTHSGAAQSLEFVGVTFEWVPLSRAEYLALTAAVDALAGKISTSLTAIGRDYNDPDVWVVYTPFDARGMWPERPKGRLQHHLIMGSGRLGGPIWHVAHVAPARV